MLRWTIDPPGTRAHKLVQRVEVLLCLKISSSFTSSAVLRFFFVAVSLLALVSLCDN